MIWVSTRSTRKGTSTDSPSLSVTVRRSLPALSSQPRRMPADVGGGFEAFQYRTLLAVSASLGLPYHLVTGDVRQANYSSLRAELVDRGFFAVVSG